MKHAASGQETETSIVAHLPLGARDTSQPNLWLFRARTRLM